MSQTKGHSDSRNTGESLHREGTLGRGGEFPGTNQVRKAGRIVRVSGTVMVTGRKRTPSINNCHDEIVNHFVGDFSFCSLFPVVQLEFMFLWKKNLEGLYVSYPDFSVDTTQISAT